MLKTFVDGAGKTTTYSYDGNDNLTQITNPAGDITQITYDSSHRVTSIKRITNNTTMAGDTTNIVYFSGYTIIEDPLYAGGTPTPGAAHTTTLYYDSQGHRTKVVDGKNHIETTTWSSDNQMAGDTSPKNQGGTPDQSLQNKYDANNNLQEQIAPNTAANGTQSGADTKWSYNPSGSHPYLPDSVTNPSSSQYSFSYESTNSNLTQIAGGSAATQANYDYNHLSYSPQAKCSITTDTGPIGTVRCSKDGAGHEAYYNYDAAGNLTKISPPPGGNPDAPRGTTQITNDALSRISTVTDGLNQQTTYKYDGDDRVNEIDYADGTKITYTYDGDGNMTQRVDSGANGGTSSYTYDLKNRLTQRQDPYGTSTYGYDAADSMLSMHDSGGTVSYGYDTANQLCYVYVGSATNTCDANDVGAPSGATSFKYDADGNRTTTTYPGSTQVVMTQSYDNADRLTDINAAKGGSKFIDFAYTYVAAPTDKDVRQSVTDIAGNKTTYTYDTLDRLQEATTKTSGGSTTFDRTYAYDGASNLCWTYNGSQASPTCTTEPTSGVTTYRYGTDNQLCWYASGTSSNTCGSPPSAATSFSYDANGMESNDTSSSIGGTSSYNARGQYTDWRGVTPEDYLGPDQTERTVNGVDSYQYNALGLGERTHSGSANYYTRDPKGTLVSDRTGGSTYNYVFDGLGSVVALTDTNGNVVNSYSYDPQGNVIGTPTENVDNPWRFAAGLWSPSTGTLKYGDRFYDPSIDRWTQPDLVDQNGIRIGNDYVYAGDDPVNSADPTGMLSLELGGCAFHVCGGINISSGCAPPFGSCEVHPYSGSTTESTPSLDLQDVTKDVHAGETDTGLQSSYGAASYSHSWHSGSSSFGAHLGKPGTSTWFKRYY